MFGFKRESRIIQKFSADYYERHPELKAPASSGEVIKNKYEYDAQGKRVGPSPREPYGRYVNDNGEIIILEPGEQEAIEKDKKIKKSDLWEKIEKRLGRPLGNPKLVPWLVDFAIEDNQKEYAASIRKLTEGAQTTRAWLPQPSKPKPN